MSGMFKDALEEVEMTMKQHGAPAEPTAQQRFASDVDAVLHHVRHVLLRKNEMYGDSALNPLRVLSRSSTSEQLRVRIDDKLSRLRNANNSNEADDEDTLLDLLGYLVILRISMNREKGL